MIRMACDACGAEVPPERNGAIRLKIGNREYTFHLCPAHQGVLRDYVRELLATYPWTEKGSSRAVET